MADHLKELLGNDGVSDSSELCFKYSFAGKIPSHVLFPTSTDQIATLFKLAKKDSKKIMICGKNSQHQFGGKFNSLDWCIALNRMNHIIEHEAADLVVTVEPGTTLHQLQKFLKSHKQFLAVDPHNSEKRTLGGIVASNSYGPLRMHYGTCRDLVLGMKVVLPDGTTIRAGGKTVKNVAGYDLSKLFIGSMGTLGAISELTFKLSPVPAKRQTLWAEFKQFGKIPDLVRSVCSSNLAISRCEYFNHVFIEKTLHDGFKSKEPHHMLFSVSGNSEMVKATVESLQMIISANEGRIFRLYSDDEDDDMWNHLLNTTEGEYQTAFHAQMSIQKAYLGKAIDSLHKYSFENSISIAIQAHAGNGIIHLLWGEPSRDKNLKSDQFNSQIKKFRQIAQNFHGSLIMSQSPDVMRDHELIWGKPSKHYTFSKAIKLKYDSNQVLSTGRFIGGL